MPTKRHSAAFLALALAHPGCSVLDPTDDIQDGASTTTSSSPDCGGLHGPAMVRVGDADYCIDSTEVSVAEYAEFVFEMDNKQVPTSGQERTACSSSNTSWRPGDNADWVPSEEEKPLPMTAIGWCDAFGYCAWAGKRLCGAIGGDRLDQVDLNNPERDQWYRACSENGKRTYPYDASDFDEQRCATYKNPATGMAIQAASAELDCEGGYPGIFNMIGNAAEYIDSCNADTGANDRCDARGGSFADQEALASCNAERSDPENFKSRHDGGATVGFRCCSP